MAEGASARRSMVPSVGTFCRNHLVARAATTNIPERTAFSTAVAQDHMGGPGSPQAAPTSSGPAKGRTAQRKHGDLHASLRASLMALMTTSPVVKSFTPESRHLVTAQIRLGAIQ